MDTTAEGVETLDELELVRVHGCSHVQGYVYAKPLTGAEATLRLEQGVHIRASGPRSARARRFTMLRKVVLESGDHLYNGTIRNISVKGAMVEGLWNVPVGTRFNVAVSETLILHATCRWNIGDRMGLELDHPLQTEDDGAITMLARVQPQGRAALSRLRRVQMHQRYLWPRCPPGTGSQPGG